MDIKHSLIFQQTDLEQTPVQTVSYPTVRTRQSAPCPGRLDNIILLVSGEDAMNGISRPKNIGTCILHIACYDRSGTYLQSMRLAPGEEVDWYRVPVNTHAIKFGCHKECIGTAILEYDTSNIG